MAMFKVSLISFLMATVLLNMASAVPSVCNSPQKKNKLYDATVTALCYKGNSTGCAGIINVPQLAYTAATGGNFQWSSALICALGSGMCGIDKANKKETTSVGKLLPATLKVIPFMSQVVEAKTSLMCAHVQQACCRSGATVEMAEALVHYILGDVNQILVNIDTATERAVVIVKEKADAVLRAKDYAKSVIDSIVSMYKSVIDTAKAVKDTFTRTKRGLPAKASKPSLSNQKGLTTKPFRGATAKAANKSLIIAPSKAKVGVMPIIAAGGQIAGQIALDLSKTVVNAISKDIPANICKNLTEQAAGAKASDKAFVSMVDLICGNPKTAVVPGQCGGITHDLPNSFVCAIGAKVCQVGSKNQQDSIAGKLMPLLLKLVPALTKAVDNPFTCAIVDNACCRTGGNFDMGNSLFNLAVSDMSSILGAIETVGDAVCAAINHATGDMVQLNTKLLENVAVETGKSFWEGFKLLLDPFQLNDYNMQNGRGPGFY